MKPGYVKIGKDGKTLHMPNLMSIDFEVYKKINASTTINQKMSKLKDGDPKKEELAIESQNSTIEAINLMLETYEDYREFSKGFSIIDHIRVIASIGRGVKKVEIEQMIGETMIVAEEDDKDIEASKEPDSFLS